MKITNAHILMILMALVMILLFRCNESDSETGRIRSEYLRRHEYTRQKLNNIKFDLASLSKRLDQIMDSSEQRSNDSLKSVLQESFFTIGKCEHFFHEIEEFEKYDSLMFELYVK